MKLQKKLKLAFGMLINSKLRSWLTIIGIVIAVASVTMILSFSQGIKIETQNAVGGSDAGILNLQAGYSELRGIGVISINDYKELEKIQEIKYLSRGLSGSGNLVFKDKENYISIKGVFLDEFENFKSSYKLDEGTWISQENQEIIISKDFLNRSFEDNLRPKLYDYVEIEENRYQITGIFSTEGLFSFGGGDVIISNSNFLEIKEKKENISIYDTPENSEVPYKDIYGEISIIFEKGVLVSEGKEIVEQRLYQTRNVDKDSSDFYLSSKDEILKELNKILDIVTWVLVGFAGISILVGSVGVANTMFTSVLEKTKEIGIMKAIGANDSDIKQIFIFNSGMLGLAGGIIGVVLGLGFALIIGFIVIYFAKIPDISILNLIDIKIILGALLFSISIGMVSGYFPAKNAAKMDPVEALRSE